MVRCGGLGVPFGVHFGFSEWPWTSLLGVPLGAFGAQGVSKTASLDQWRTILTDFGAERVPKWLPKLTKNHLKSIKTSMKNMVGFLNGFGTVFR